MKRTLGLAAALALAACQAKAPAPAEPPVRDPAGAVMDISQPLTARGTEPFWSLTINGSQFRLTRPDHPDLAIEAGGAVIQSGRATWVAKGAGGEQVTVVLYASDCSDGMSDTKYPYAAEVVMLNESLRGCAGKTASLPKPAG
ncbi:MAG TPA: hypothetical protein VF495_20435 [Phenylobacterium sp.]